MFTIYLLLYHMITGIAIYILLLSIDNTFNVNCSNGCLQFTFYFIAWEQALSFIMSCYQLSKHSMFIVIMDVYNLPFTLSHLNMHYNLLLQSDNTLNVYCSNGCLQFTFYLITWEQALSFIIYCYKLTTHWMFIVQMDIYHLPFTLLYENRHCHLWFNVTNW